MSLLVKESIQVSFGNKMEDIKKRIVELTNILNKANYEYYNLDNPSITDQEYDKYLRELIDLEVKTRFQISSLYIYDQGIT